MEQDIKADRTSNSAHSTQHTALPLTIALAKGRMQDEALHVLACAGVSVSDEALASRRISIDCFPASATPRKSPRGTSARFRSPYLYARSSR